MIFAGFAVVIGGLVGLLIERVAAHRRRKMLQRYGCDLSPICPMRQRPGCGPR